MIIYFVIQGEYEKNNIINCSFDDECKLFRFHVYQGTGTTGKGMFPYYKWWYTMFL